VHSRPLDRSKPLWEAYVIEGLHNVPGVPPGSFAMYTKIHHSLIDGESGSELIRALHSLTPEPVDEESFEPDATFAADRDPTAVELYSRAVVNGIERLPSLAKFSLGAARKLASFGATAVNKLTADTSGTVEVVRTLLSGDISPLVPKLFPKTRFSGDVSAHRVVEAIGLQLAEFKVIRQHVPGATINDIFLAIVGGALRTYLDSKNELPDTSMIAMVPLTLRGADKGGDRGNQVGFTAMPVHTDIAEPVERLKAIIEAAVTAKRVTEEIGKEFARDLLENLPHVVSETLLRSVKLPGVGLIVSNVRGPDVPLYMAGARLVNYAPISIAVDGLGLNVTGFSYAGTMWICAVSCRDMLPDPAFFAECLRASFAELCEAAARVALPEESAASQAPKHPRHKRTARRTAAAARKPPSRRRKDATT